jgi:hypothetical protein
VNIDIPSPIQFKTSKYADYIQKPSPNEKSAAPVQIKLDFNNSSCGLSSVEIDMPMTQNVPDMSSENSFMRNDNIGASWKGKTAVRGGFDSDSSDEGEVYHGGKALDFHS